MISAQWARSFAAEWIAAWNAHDLERILSHYTDDFEMHSPLIIERMGVSSGALRCKAAVRPYWQRSFEARPALQFELHDVLVGVDSIAIYYFSVARIKMVTELLRFNEQRQVVYSAALYSQP